MTDEWVEWHRGYGGGRSHAGRLRVVQARIREALSAAPPGPIRVVSLCAGDGRDLLGVLAEHPRARDVRARLVDITAELTESARAEVHRLGLDAIEVRTADASTTTALEGAVPADLVLACGIFGNVSDDDVRTTIAHLPELCARGATVVWTRGRFAPDLTPRLRAWFVESGFAELSFDTVPGSTASVGAARLATEPRPFRPGVRLFTFLEKGARPADRPSAARGGTEAAPAPTAGGHSTSHKRNETETRSGTR